MVDSAVMVLLAKAKEKADQSVDYTPKYGAICPECGKKRLPVITSRGWAGDSKVRYHRCPNKPGCILAVMETSIKSVQSNTATAGSGKKST